MNSGIQLLPVSIQMVMGLQMAKSSVTQMETGHLRPVLK